MNLAETGLAKKWLHQFEADDRKYARLLLESLVLVPRETITRELGLSIPSEAEKVNEDKTTIALVPVVEAERPWEDNNRESYYEPLTDRDAKAGVLSPNDLPGSEGIIANVAEQSRRSYGQLFLKHQSLKGMREGRCNTVFFLEDFVGSGNRVISFLDYYERHPTIRSWRSFGWLQYYLIVFSVTEAGLKAIRRRRPELHVKYSQKCPTFYSAPWTAQDRQQIERICIKYAGKRGRSMALGFKESRGLLVFEHSVPNNLPAILWKPQKKWEPLFPRNAVPPALFPCFKASSPIEQIRDRLLALGERRLGQGNWINIAAPDERSILVLLAALKRYGNKIERLMDATSLTRQEIEKFLAISVSMGLLDSNFQLSPAGEAQIGQTQKFKWKRNKKIATNEDMYYPRSLREAQ